MITLTCMYIHAYDARTTFPSVAIIHHDHLKSKTRFRFALKSARVRHLYYEIFILYEIRANVRDTTLYG